MTQNNLGNALKNLGEREAGTERLELAVEAYLGALEMYVCEERVSFNCAATQNNLGNALLILGDRQAEAERLEQAADAYRAALAAFDAEESPRHRDMIEGNLQRVLKKLQESQS